MGHAVSCNFWPRVYLTLSLRSSAVEGHFSHPHGREWMYLADRVTPLLAGLVGELRKS
jgi:hypothetical protein